MYPLSNVVNVVCAFGRSAQVLQNIVECKMSRTINESVSVYISPGFCFFSTRSGL